MEINWERTSYPNVNIYTLIFAVFIIGYMFGNGCWYNFGFMLIFIKIFDIIIDIGVSTYEHFKGQK